jgi:hypothetical protein
MSERTKKFAVELDRLISEGDMLEHAIRRECDRKNFDADLLKACGNDKDKMNEAIKKLPSFRSNYQKWYSEAQAVIKQVIPGRLADFVSYFEYSKPRKDITFQNYMIRDYLQGLCITRWNEDVVVDGSAAIPEFVQQNNILKAAKATLDSVLLDLKAVLQADLFDSEIETAVALAKSGYLRATGAICGVIIEKHLSNLCEIHGVAVRKKNPGISDLNQLLRDNEIITVPQWRFVQHLADIRNICDHAKGREPTKEEIDDLVAGSEKVLKTMF